MCSLKYGFLRKVIVELHCPKNNPNPCIITEPIKVGSDTKVHTVCEMYTVCHNFVYIQYIWPRNQTRKYSCICSIYYRIGFCAQIQNIFGTVCSVRWSQRYCSTNKIVSLTYLETKGPHFLKSIFGKVYYVTFQKVFLMEGKKTLAVCHLSALAN